MIDKLNYNCWHKNEDFDNDLITDIAWNAFKKTGDINMYLEFKEIKSIEENIKGSSNETNKSKWSNLS